jgi:hypothetical protein
MDRLLDSFKVADNEAYSIMYFIVFAVILTIILVVIGGIFMLKSGFTPQYFLSKVPIPPNVAVNSILYFFAGAVFIVIIYMLIKSQTNYSIGTLEPDNQGVIPLNKTFWKPATLENPLDPRNLRVTESEWKPKKCNGLTLGVEIVIFNSRAPSVSSPYRHLLYKGSSDLQSFEQNAPGSAPLGAGGLNDGLPSEMSPGVFLDRFTNDIIVFVDTDPVDAIYSNVNHAFRESIRINDLPLNVPFYLHLTLNGKVLEVYVNCRLAGTKLLHGKPRSVPNEWFGRTGFATAQAIVQNLTLWDGVLNTFDLMKLCGSKIQIKKETWDLAIAGNLPSIGVSKCGEISVTSKSYSTGISVSHT